jgi:uncharacterized protein YraI
VHENCCASWCSVEDRHSLGWVHRHYIAMVSPAMYCVSGIASGDELNLRAFPSPQSRVTTRLTAVSAILPFCLMRSGTGRRSGLVAGKGW